MTLFGKEQVQKLILKLIKSNSKNWILEVSRGQIRVLGFYNETI